MIASFGDKYTESLYMLGESKHFPIDVIPRALRKLDMVDAATCIDDLKTPPGNRLHPLDGDLKGFHSIRINDQWHIVFEFKGEDAYRVKVCDYHR